MLVNPRRKETKSSRIYFSSHEILKESDTVPRLHIGLHACTVLMFYYCTQIVSFPRLEQNVLESFVPPAEVKEKKANGEKKEGQVQEHLCLEGSSI